MDSQNVGRGRGGLIPALQKVQAKTLVIGIASDLLFPIEEQAFIARHIPKAQLEIIESPYGHDGFLVETECISGLLLGWMEDREGWRQADRPHSGLAATVPKAYSALPGSESF